MSIILANDHTGVGGDTLAVFREEPPKGYEAGVLFTNKDVAGVTLADMKTVHFGVTLPKNLATGVIRSGYVLRVPMAPRADGTPRYCMRVVTDYVPADIAGTNDATEYWYNTTNVGVSIEAQDLITKAKIKV
jgi:hypothetical protein